MASAAARAYGHPDHHNPVVTQPNPPPSLPPDPLPADKPQKRGHRYSFSQRVQCLTLLAEGISHSVIERKTGVKPAAQSYIKKRAFKRGFRPEVDPCIRDHHVQDGARTGRPKRKSLPAEQQLIQKRPKMNGTDGAKSSQEVVDLMMSADDAVGLAVQSSGLLSTHEFVDSGAQKQASDAVDSDGEVSDNEENDDEDNL